MNAPGCAGGARVLESAPERERRCGQQGRVARLIERRRQRTNLRLLWLSQFANTAGLMMLIPVMPLYMRDLGAPANMVGIWAGAAIAAPALPLALVTPLWGRLGDRVGQKWMVVRALVGLAMAMALMALAASPAALLVARLAQGAFGGVVEAAAAFVSSDSRDEDRAGVMGRSYSATAAGAVAGPLAGGALMSTGRLDLLLLGIAGAASILAGLCTFTLKPRRRATPHRQPGMKGRKRPQGVQRAIGLQVLLAGAMMYFGVYGLIPVYAEYVASLVSDPGKAAAWVGGLHSVMWTGTMIGSIYWGWHNQRNHRPLVALTWGCVLTAAAMLIQAWVASPVLLAMLRFVQGFAFAALAQSLMLHASRRATNDTTAEFVGTANSYLLIGQFLGPLVGGALLSAISPTVAVTLAATAVGGAAALLWVPSRRPVARALG